MLQRGDLISTDIYVILIDCITHQNLSPAADDLMIVADIAFYGTSDVSCMLHVFMNGRLFYTKYTHTTRELNDWFKRLSCVK